jgi:hypothetical protein
MVTERTSHANEAPNFNAKTPEELLEQVRARYGERVESALRQVVERVGVQKLTLDDTKPILAELQSAGLNGNAEALLSTVTEHSRQLAAKQAVSERWYQKIGRYLGTGLHYAKEAIMTPIRAIGGVMRRHPVLTTITIAVILGALGYWGAMNLEGWIGAGPDLRTAELGGGLAEGAPAPTFNVPVDVSTVQPAVDGAGVYPQSSIPNVIPIPD